MRDTIKDIRFILRKAREERTVTELLEGYEKSLRKKALRGEVLPLTREALHLEFHARFLSESGKKRLEEGARELHRKYTNISKTVRATNGR